MISLPSRTRPQLGGRGATIFPSKLGLYPALQASSPRVPSVLGTTTGTYAPSVPPTSEAGVHGQWLYTRVIYDRREPPMTGGSHYLRELPDPVRPVTGNGNVQPR